MGLSVMHIGITARTRLSRAIAAALAAGLLATAPAAAVDLEDRLDRLEELLEGRGLAELVRDIERLKRENQELRGEVEQLTRQVRILEDRQRSHYADLDDRLQGIEAAPPVPEQEVVEEDEPAEPDRVAIPELTPSGEKANEAERYRTAFARLGDGLYEDAREEFQRLIDDFPDGAYAANARYWIAESYYADREFESAGEHFQMVLDDHPESDKVADAMLKLGFVAFEEGDIEQASAHLEKVREEHPDTTAASLAQQRLSEIRRLQ